LKRAIGLLVRDGLLNRTNYCGFDRGTFEDGGDDMQVVMKISRMCIAAVVVCLIAFVSFDSGAQDTAIQEDKPSAKCIKRKPWDRARRWERLSM
jgi:hypothetical protein